MPLAKNSNKIGFSFYDKIDCFFLWLWKGKKTNDDFRRKVKRRGDKKESSCALLRALLAGGKKSVQQTCSIERSSSMLVSLRNWYIGGGIGVQSESVETTPLAPLATLGSMPYAATCDVLLFVSSSSPGVLDGLEEGVEMCSCPIGRDKGCCPSL